MIAIDRFESLLHCLGCSEDQGGCTFLPFIVLSAFESVAEAKIFLRSLRALVFDELWDFRFLEMCCGLLWFGSTRCWLQWLLSFESWPSRIISRGKLIGCIVDSSTIGVDCAMNDISDVWPSVEVRKGPL